MGRARGMMMSVSSIKSATAAIALAVGLAMVLAIGLALTPAFAQSQLSSLHPSPVDPALRGTQAPQGVHAPVGNETSVPLGWIEFCARVENVADCAVPAMAPLEVSMNRKAWRTVERINQSVNASIIPVSDMEQYGVEEKWAYPDSGKGDCEDYVLLKRRMLIRAGFPRQSLLITVVRDLQDEGHAVLTLRTTKGDFILDNKRDKIVNWDETGYRFIKRQSLADPNIWVDLRVAPALAASQR